MNQGLRETSSRSVNANDRSWCFSAHFGFGCLDLAFLKTYCWVKTLTGRKDTPTPVIGIRRPGATLRRALLWTHPKYSFWAFVYTDGLKPCVILLLWRYQNHTMKCDKNENNLEVHKVLTTGFIRIVWLNSSSRALSIVHGVGQKISPWHIIALSATPTQYVKYCCVDN